MQVSHKSSTRIPSIQALLTLSIMELRCLQIQLLLKYYKIILFLPLDSDISLILI